MDMMNALVESGGADSIARELGVDPQTAQAGMSALLPAVVGGIQQQALSSSGQAGSLSSVLAGLGGDGLLDNALGEHPTDVAQGNQILGQIFGSKDTSRQVAAHAAQSSGLSSDLLKKMLPIIAMMASGYLMNKRSKAGGAAAGGGSVLGGLAGSVLGSLLGGGGGSRSAQSNPFGSILSSLTRG